MARTNTYKSQVKNAAAYVNKKISDIENLFGIGSEQYDRYVNAVSAALPAGTYTLSESGKLRIKTGKATQESVKLGQLRPVVNLPTASHSMKQSKLALAKNKLQAAGIEKPDAAAIKEEALSIDDIEALQELAAKSFIQNMENSKGKLKYTESMRAELKQKGKKTYTQLREIIERGQTKDAERKAKKADYQRRYRAEHREEVNRKQREYRARKRARS